MIIYLKNLKRLAAWVYVKLYYYLTILQNLFFYSKNRTYEKIIGNIDIHSKNKICIFVHHDTKSKVAEYVFKYLQELNSQGCAIVFVTSSGDPGSECIQKLQPIVSKIIIRPNYGYDFGSYYIGFQQVRQYNHHDLLIFANDSVYGPFCSLQPIFDLVEQGKVEAASITDSYDINYHLQSYFLVLSPKVFNSKAFHNFFDNFVFCNNKRFVVYKYELGLTQLLIAEKFKVTAFCSYKKLFNSQLQFQDATITYATDLVEKHRCPFIKKKLFSMFPGKINSYYQVITKTGYDINLIKKHLDCL